MGEPTVAIVVMRDPASAYYGERTRQEPWSPFSSPVRSTRGGVARDYRLFRTIVLELAIMALFVGGLFHWKPGSAPSTLPPGVQSMLTASPRIAMPAPAAASPMSDAPLTNGIVLYRPFDRSVYAPPSVPIPTTPHPYIQ